jgi:YegS/Rv2252/BmrU family lipid kinase
MASVFLLINPFAGSSEPDRVLRAVHTTLDSAGWAYKICRASEWRATRDAVEAAIRQGFQLCVAVGGDGTVSRVASGLVNSGIPLAIVPTGTGNVLARDLGIPATLEGALHLLCDTHRTQTIDAMAIGKRLLFIAVGVGVSGLMMRDTGRAEKRRFGRIAYLRTGFRSLLGVQPHAFQLQIDGQHHHLSAAEVMVANLGAVGEPSIRWGPHVLVNDATVDICVVRARSALDLVRIAGTVLLRRQRQDPNLRFLRAQQHVHIAADLPLPVQGDGDFVGYTPVQIRVVPSALRVIVPPDRCDDRFVLDSASP